ncbi:unnamed protein product [Phaedon cochleariae]|uniref:Endonuclease-reverse transcriptase n=1 Tax=Phaedon cochleariae TaxID=80249 RepID=A0A9P0DKR1_PHACE|nr:unnamed protein product [Phaedon cochleariae]
MMSGGELSTRELYELLKKSQEEQTEIITKEINKNKEELEKKLLETEKQIIVLEERNLTLERQLKKNNIIVFGLNQTPENLLEQTLANLNNLLGLNLQKHDINNLYEIGKHEGNKGVLIQFVSFLNKKNIFKNIAKLKNTKISIVNDLCPQDREKQKVLVKHLKAARENNKKARIRGFKLEINDKLYSVEELENLDSESEFESQSEEDTDIGGEEESSLNQKPTEKKKRNRTSPVSARETKKRRGHTGNNFSPKNTRAKTSEKSAK